MLHPVLIVSALAVSHAQSRLVKGAHLGDLVRNLF
jgi:hypothetical protein